MMILCTLVLTAISGIICAQTTAAVNTHQRTQHARIHEGIASGEVTPLEAKKLRAEQRNIRRVERRAKADGKVSRHERARLHRKQKAASRDIRRQKHDHQEK
jgi:hypothetical protein